MRYVAMKSKGIVLLLIVLLMMSVLAGCGKKEAATDTKKAAKETAQTVSGKVQLTDMAGRKLEVPAKINRVFSTNPVGMILVYSLAPEKMAAINYKFTPEAAKYVQPEFAKLPNVGGWYGETTCNTEELMKIHPDVILSVSILNESTKSQADQIQKQLGIPVVVLDYDINQLDKCYEFAGKLLGEEKRAAELGSYCRQTLDDVKKKAATIKPDERVKVYYAEGPKGLQTEPKGSMHMQVLEMVGADNVANVAMKGGMGMTPVSLEQVLAWNPDVILTWTMVGQKSQVYDTITGDARWSKVEAIKDKKVYEVPAEPYNWFDRPPSVGRVLGLKWLGNLLYPDVYKYDMVKETKTFYKKFYHYDLTDKEVKELLNRAAN